MFLEQQILKEMVGSQDQTIASYGGFNSIKFFRSGNIKVTPIIKNPNILELVYFVETIENFIVITEPCKTTLLHLLETETINLTTE